jgi:hypothetical protein
VVVLVGANITFNYAPVFYLVVRNVFIEVPYCQDLVLRAY